MKIVHIAPNAPYNEGWGYQDNLLPRYQHLLGHDVTMIITNYTHENGRVVETNCCDYHMDDGVHLIRLARKKYFCKAATMLMSKLEVYSMLVRLEPDLIFFHGLASNSIFDAIKYKKKRLRQGKSCLIIQDNHDDWNNSSGRNGNGVKPRLVRSLHRLRNRLSIPYVEKVYGVTPWRKQYAEEYYGIPVEKTDVLIMGADDVNINFSHRNSIRLAIRKQYGIAQDAFLIVTGGKIDKKKKMDVLIKSVQGLDVELLIFGSVSSDDEAEFTQLVKEAKNVHYVGWVSSDKVYDYFFAADIAVFLGGHSVLWEQACASKIPCIFQYWPGMTHLDCGGNSLFVAEETAERIGSLICEIRMDGKYNEMRQIAASGLTDVYRYSEIARKSIMI